MQLPRGTQMTGKELRTLREGVGITIPQLAELCRIPETTVKKHERGDFAIPKALADLYVAIEHGLLADSTRWMLPSKQKMPGKTWTKGPWDVYRTLEVAEKVQSYVEDTLGSELTAPVRIYVKKFLLDSGVGRQRWGFARLAKKG